MLVEDAIRIGLANNYQIQIARTEAEIQKITDAAIKDVDEVVKAKEVELMSV